jgi:hypothetical protein
MGDPPFDDTRVKGWETPIPAAAPPSRGAWIIGNRSRD